MCTELNIAKSSVCRFHKVKCLLFLLCVILYQEIVLSFLPCWLMVFTLFLYFHSIFIDFFILEAATTEIIWYDKKKRKTQGSLSFCGINHCCEGGFLDCPCPWLWCNQRVRPCCSQPETPHLMRMLCAGSLSHTNTVFCVSHRTHNCADYSILFSSFHRALNPTPLSVWWLHQNTWTFLTWCNSLTSYLSYIINSRETIALNRMSKIWNLRWINGNLAINPVIYNHLFTSTVSK